MNLLCKISFMGSMNIVLEWENPRNELNVDQCLCGDSGNRKHRSTVVISKTRMASSELGCS